MPYGKVHDPEQFTQDADVNILLAGEIADLRQAVERLNGYRRGTITDIKNA